MCEQEVKNFENKYSPGAYEIKKWRIRQNGENDRNLLQIKKSYCR